MARLIAFIIGLTTVSLAAAQPATITFGTTNAISPATYQEQGLVFTGDLSIDGAPDAYLYGAAPGAIITVSSDTPFDLLGFTIERLDAQPWNITTSAGGSQQLTSSGLVDFTGTAGFQGITSFTLAENIGFPAPNIIIYVDDVDVVFVPEPSAAALLMLGCISLAFRRRGITNRCS